MFYHYEHQDSKKNVIIDSVMGIYLIFWFPSALGQCTQSKQLYLQYKYIA